jgi:archaellum component FlaC
MTPDEKNEIKKLHEKIDHLQSTVDVLSEKLARHIEFIDKTYDGLKNPIDAARRWLGR